MTEPIQIRDRIKELRRVPASSLVPHDRNWRRHNVEQRRALRAMLERIGFAGAVLTRELPDGRLQLCDGHLRADEAGSQLVPALVTDLTEAEALQLLATYDPIGVLAEMDVAALLQILDAAPPLPAETFEAMYPAGLPTIGKDDADLNEAPPVPAEPVTKLGDIWKLGEHRLLCGDSTQGPAVERLLGGAKPGLMVTDPPYGVSYDPAWRDAADKNRWGRSSIGKVTNDDRADWSAAVGLFQGSVAYVWHAGVFTAAVEAVLTRAGMEIRSQIIWRKAIFAISRGHYHWQHEPCWYAIRKGATAGWCGGRAQTTTWDIAGLHAMGGGRSSESPTGHGTQKPLECMERPMRNHRARQVYDPFAGSGTSIIAAERLGKTCYAVELEPGYCDVIIGRWEKFTGKKAKRAKE